MKTSNLTLLAITFVLLGDISVVLMGAFGKQLGLNGYSVFEIALLRNICALTIVTCTILSMRSYELFKSRRIKKQFLRSIVGTSGLICLFLAYKHIPFATVNIILFIGPIIAAFFATFMLGERVGVTRWIALILGFCGIIVIYMPTIFSQSIANASIIGLSAAFISAILSALVQIFLRFFGKEGEPPLTTIFYFLSFGTAMLFIPVLITGFRFDVIFLPVILGLGIFGFGNQIFHTYGYKWGEASMLAPFRYASVIWAIVIGYIIWDEIPSFETWVGGAIIIIANVMLILRERKTNDQKQVATPNPK